MTNSAQQFETEIFRTLAIGKGAAPRGAGWFGIG